MEIFKLYYINKLYYYVFINIKIHIFKYYEQYDI